MGSQRASRDEGLIEGTMQEASVELGEAEIQRLIRAMQQHVEAGAIPEVLRCLTEELEKRASAERRCAELFERERVARAEARRSVEANRAKDRFLAVVSHELRTPLQPVLAAACALLRDPRMPPELLDEVRTIQRNVQLEARLIDDLLDLTRVTSGKLALEPARINLDSVITRAVEICEPDAVAKKLTLSTDLRATRPWVNGDPGRLQQVLWNLIKNAVKFTPAGGMIAITTADAPAGEDSAHNGAANGLGAIALEVIDNGIGIEPAQLTRIFEAFEQGGSDIAGRYGGLGLGLAISKVLTEMHAGTLCAHSDGPGRGARFCLTLPRVEVPATAAAGSPRGVYPAQPTRRALRILLVDDDADGSRVLAKLLQRTGHDVAVAMTCAAALEAARDGRFDLLLGDISLPDGSGLDLVRSLAPAGIGRAIALTGYGGDDDVAASLAAGYDVHLTKPITLEQLVKAINRLFP